MVFPTPPFKFNMVIFFMVFVSFRFNILAAAVQLLCLLPACGCFASQPGHCWYTPVSFSVEVLLALPDMLHNPGRWCGKLLFVWDNLYRSSSHLISMDTSAVLFCAWCQILCLSLIDQICTLAQRPTDASIYDDTAICFLPVRLLHCSAHILCKSWLYPF